MKTMLFVTIFLVNPSLYAGLTKIKSKTKPSITYEPLPDEELLKIYIKNGGNPEDLQEQSSYNKADEPTTSMPSFEPLEIDLETKNTSIGSLEEGFNFPLETNKQIGVEGTVGSGGGGLGSTQLIDLNPLTSKKKKAPAVKVLSDKVNKMIEIIPSEELKNGLLTYLKIIKAESYQSDHSVGASNQGVSAHHTNVISNNNICFASMVDEFYSEINKIDKDHDIVAGRLSDNSKRANLYMESGKGDSKDLKPGWLWDLAMEKSKGNPNIAMRIIGACGHDDISQGFHGYTADLTTVEQKEKYIKENIPFYYSPDLSPRLQNKAIKGYMEDKKRIMKSDSVKKSIACPGRNSRMFLSNALGNNVSIDKKTKDKIIKIQGKGIDSTRIPSKNYHIMGASYMTCRLIEEGIPAPIAAKAQETAAWAYRTLRISTKIEEDLEEYNSFKEAQSDYNKRNNTSLTLKDFMLLDHSEREVKRTMNKIHAAQIFENRYIGVDGIITHTNIMPYWNRDRGTIKVSTHYYGGKVHDTGLSRDKPKDWTEKEYQDALHKVDTYLVDWEWTVKQHKIGADFAADNCKPIKYGDSIDEEACKAVEGKYKSCSDTESNGNANINDFASHLNNITVGL